MSLDACNHILALLTKQPGWELYQEYQRIIQIWETTVGSFINAHTRPLSLNGNVLWVATSSAVWAQHLSLQRHTLRKKLNARLTITLEDIRFNAAQWHSEAISNISSPLSEPHPSSIELEMELNQLPLGDTPETAFQRWSDLIRERASSLAICPQCQSPTPFGELQRWSVCAICATKQWQKLEQL